MATVPGFALHAPVFWSFGDRILGWAVAAAPAVLGLERRSHYFSKKGETFEACEVLNTLSDQDLRGLILAQRSSHLDCPLVTWQFLEGIRNREDFARRVREMKGTHVLFEPEMMGFTRWMDVEEVFNSPTFREIGRWPWKQRDWVRLYSVESP